MKTLVLAAAALGGLGLASAAQAAPLAPSPAVAGSATVDTVALGCGPGFTRGRFGQCRPFGPRFGFGPRRFDGPRRGYGRPYGPRRFYRY